ncbi:MAG: flagellar hook-length control protein FliK [Kangiellaceae bacterium]
MKITSNDIGSNNSTQQAVDSKVIELLAKLASKPLLIDKLLLSKDNGLQLTVNSPEGKLQLRMPLQLAQQMQPAAAPSNKNNPSVELSLNNKSQVLLKLVSQVVSKNRVVSSTRATQSPVLSQVVFGQARLVNPELLKLDSAILPTPNNQTSTNKAITANPLLKSNQTVDNRTINKSVNLEANLRSSHLKGLHTLASQHNSPTLQGKLSLVSVSQAKPNSFSSIRLTPAAISNQSIDPNKIIKNFLRQSFPSKGGLASTIQNLQYQIKELRQIVSKSLAGAASNISKSSVPIANQIIGQSNSIAELMNQLTRATSRPQLSNAASIMERLSNSGNLFENKLASFSQSSTDVSSAKDPLTILKSNSIASPLLMNAKANTSSSESAQLLSGKVKAKTLNNPSNQSNLSVNDIKLLLVQLKAQVEKLISQINSLQPRTLTEPASQTAPQSANNQTAVLTEQIRRELENNPNTLLRKENTTGVGVANQGKRAAASLSNLLLTVGQSNQLTKALSEIVIEVRAALSQIETNQLLSLRAEQPNIHQFLVDLPFSNNKQIDSFELLIEHQNENLTKSVKQWKVVVRFDLDPLGPMFAQVQLKDNRISTNIFAESQPTAKLINEHLHVLQKSLADAGLDIDQVAGSQGKIPESLAKNTEHSVDIRV